MMIKGDYAKVQRPKGVKGKHYRVKNYAKNGEIIMINHPGLDGADVRGLDGKMRCSVDSWSYLHKLPQMKINSLPHCLSLEYGRFPVPGELVWVVRHGGGSASADIIIDNRIRVCDTKCLSPVDEKINIFEMLHGIQPKLDGARMIRKPSEHLPAPAGWDNCRRGYCQGDWLIKLSGNTWRLEHPSILLANAFKSPQDAVNFIKDHFK